MSLPEIKLRTKGTENVFKISGHGLETNDRAFAEDVLAKARDSKTPPYSGLQTATPAV